MHTIVRNSPEHFAAILQLDMKYNDLRDETRDAYKLPNERLYRLNAVEYQRQEALTILRSRLVDSPAA